MSDNEKHSYYYKVFIETKPFLKIVHDQLIYMSNCDKHPNLILNTVMVQIN
jgi:hypothetical protein